MYQGILFINKPALRLLKIESGFDWRNDAIWIGKKLKLFNRACFLFFFDGLAWQKLT